MAADFETQRTEYLRRYAALRSERSSWDTHWRELSDFIQPRSSRFNRSDRNRGTKKNGNIINGTATRALRILQAGMMSGLTPRSRPWFRLTTPDTSLAQSGAVKEWLHLVEERIRLTFAKSNVYNALHGVYGHVALYGTAAMFVEEDVEDGLRAYLLPIGSYMLATSPRQQVDTLLREVTFTASQLVRRFGKERCSSTALGLAQSRPDAAIEVLHIIEPRTEFDAKRKDAKNMPWRSVWLENGAIGASGSGPNSSAQATGTATQFLRESGYTMFPATCPRWEVTGEDVYGSSPAMDVLGDVKGLQFLEKRKADLVEKLSDPPMKGPSSLMNRRASLLPGDVTYVDVNSGGQTFEPALVISPQAVGVVEESIREHEQRSNSMLFADLWLMVQNAEGAPQKTATEIAALQQEQMLQLGPVLERLEDELLDPLVDRAFDILHRSGQLPPPPPELQGQALRVEYISVLAQAQKAVGITGLERLSSFIGNLATATQKPEVLDKLDGDKLVDEYASSLGVKPDLIRSDDEVKAIRQDRAQQQQQAQATQNAMAAAQAGKTLSETQMGNGSALDRIIANGGGGGNAA